MIRSVSFDRVRARQLVDAVPELDAEILDVADLPAWAILGRRRS